MRRLRNSLGVLVTLCWLPLAAVAQSPDSTSAVAPPDPIVTLTSNLPTALVYADTVRLGVAAQGVFRVPARADSLRLMPDEGDGWTLSPEVRALDLQGGDTLAIQIDFPYHYRVESIPFGAPVFLKGLDERQLLGTTPLTHRSEAPLETPLVIDHKGYQIEEITPGRDVWNRYVITLNPAQSLRTEAPTPEVDWQPPPKRRRWIDVAAATVAVAAGVYSIHQKFQADDLYDQYQETRDPALKSRVEAYDARALAGLGVMQVGLGVLTFRLIRR